ncbi:hypothetical protein [Dyella halodurans]
MRLGAHIPLDGWCRAHLEVTAIAGAAFASLGKEHAAEAKAAWRYVSERQRSDGSWPAYWWASRHFSTLQAVELAAAMGDMNAVWRAADWVQSGQRRDGSWCRPKSVFATAASLSILAIAGGHRTCRQRASQSLSARREVDGFWPSHAEMRIPPPWVTKPDDYHPWRVHSLGTGVIANDHNRLFTSALCVAALARSERAL